MWLIKLYYNCTSFDQNKLLGFGAPVTHFFKNNKNGLKTIQMCSYSTQVYPTNFQHPWGHLLITFEICYYVVTWRKGV